MRIVIRIEDGDEVLHLAHAVTDMEVERCRDRADLCRLIGHHVEAAFRSHLEGPPELSRLLRRFKTDEHRKGTENG